MVKRAIELEGTVSVSVSIQVGRVFHINFRQGEHGIGLVKRDYLPQELGEDAVDLMRKVSGHELHIDKKCTDKLFFLDRSKWRSILMLY